MIAIVNLLTITNTNDVLKAAIYKLKGRVLRNYLILMPTAISMIHGFATIVPQANWPSVNGSLKNLTSAFLNDLWLILKMDRTEFGGENIKKDEFDRS